MMTSLLESGDSSRLALADIHIDVHGVTDGLMDLVSLGNLLCHYGFVQSGGYYHDLKS